MVRGVRRGEENGMHNNDTKRLLSWFRRMRLEDEREGRDGFRPKHAIPDRTEYEGLFTPRMRDRDVRDLTEDGYLETRMNGRLKEWRYIPRKEQEPPKVNLSNEREFAQHVLL